MSPAKVAESVQMPVGWWTRVVPRNRVLDDRVEIPMVKSNFWGLSGPLKSTGSLCSQNGSFSHQLWHDSATERCHITLFPVKNPPPCNPALYQNSLSCCYLLQRQ